MRQPNAHLFEFDSIGSRFWLEDLTGRQLLLPLREQILAYVDEFSSNYSRFKPDSLVSKLANDGTLHSPPGELIDMLEVSKRMYEVTNGVFNVTVGAALSALGYGGRHEGDKLIADPWGAMEWSKTEVHVPKGLVIDFGGLGKGWLIDGIAKILQGNGIKQFIVNGGGDLYVQNTEPVEFALEDPLTDGKVLQTVYIQQGALAGSNILKRSWENNGKRKHHIIDTATGDSSDSGVVASFVLADTALVADVMATVLIIDPRQKVKLERQFNIKTLLIRKP